MLWLSSSNARRVPMALLTPLLLVTASVSSLADDDGYQLRHNPFARAFQDPPSSGYSNEATSNDDMALRAILFDEKRPMVNVGGNILELGDEYSGYVVREIRRDSAIFYREGRATLLQMEAGEDEIAGYADAN
ncbi:MAG: hypothetical protein AB8B48_14665 [Pseudomonadales bacterium]